MRRLHLIICLIGLIPLACGGGSSSGDGGGGGGEGAPLVLAAGMVGLDPDPDADWTGGVDTSHLWVKEYDTVYDLTTPRGEDFSFDLLTRARGNSGPVRVSMAHVLDGDELGDVRGSVSVGDAFGLGGGAGSWVGTSGVFHDDLFCRGYGWQCVRRSMFADFRYDGVEFDVLWL